MTMFFSQWAQDDLRRRMTHKARAECRALKGLDFDPDDTPRRAFDPVAAAERRAKVAEALRAGAGTIEDLRQRLPDMPKSEIGAALKSLRHQGGAAPDREHSKSGPRVWSLVEAAQ